MRPWSLLVLLVVCGNGALLAWQPQSAQHGASLNPAEAAQGMRSAASVPLPRPEIGIWFDPAKVQVEWSNRRWLLVHEGEMLKDFGAREQEARQALRIIQEFGLNQYVVIGTPTPVMEYWLVDGKAPQGTVRSGMRALPLEPGTLRVEQMNGQWCVRDRSRVLFTFGAHREEAQQALAVLQHYRFDQIGLVGQPPSMYVFLSRNPDHGVTLAGTTGSRTMTPPRFSRLAKNADGTPKFEKAKSPSTATGLEGLSTPVVPALARNSTGDRSGIASKPFQWRERMSGGQAEEPKAQDRIPFDWRQVQLVLDQGEWKLKVGSTLLANFGYSAQDGRLALSAVRHYRFTEQWRLGGANPYLSYYIANATAPRSLLLGIRAEEFQPQKLELKHLETGYALCEGPRVVLRLRDSEEEGRQLLETIKRHRCDRLCKIGEPGKETMTFLVRSR